MNTHLKPSDFLNFRQRMQMHLAAYMVASLGILAFFIMNLGLIFGPKSAKELLEHISGYSEKWAFKSKSYLILLTGTPATSGNKGVTLAKAVAKETTVTNYSRFVIEAVAGHELTFKEVGEEEGELANSAEWTIQTGLTGTNQEITFWAIIPDATGEASGKIIAWGTCTGVSIGGTGTPVKIASEKLKVKVG